MANGENTPDADKQKDSDKHKNTPIESENEIETLFSNESYKGRGNIVADSPIIGSDDHSLQAENSANLSTESSTTIANPEEEINQFLSSSEDSIHEDEPKSQSSAKGWVTSKILQGDGDAPRGSENSENDQSCLLSLLSEKSSKCGDDCFGRADILRPILTEEERKMLGISPFPKIVLDKAGKEVLQGDDQEQDLPQLASSSRSTTEIDGGVSLPKEGKPLPRTTSLQHRKSHKTIIGKSPK